MPIQSCDRVCNVLGLAKHVFLTCVSLITCGCIIWGILLHLVILPHLQESKFTDANCTYADERLVRRVSCEAACSRDLSSFPCFAVSVNVSMAAGGYRAASLYENYDTFVHYRHRLCSSSPCLAEASENSEMVRRFIQTLKRKWHFPCIVDSSGSQQQQQQQQQQQLVALLSRSYSRELAIHCAIWPAAAVVFGCILLIATHHCAGCTVWTQDKTVIA